uniref:Prominin-like protein n=1 Tax=Cacopsylla melanoneura TaxID=428564 RepID=A0A8D8QGB3_9HEMI
MAVFTKYSKSRFKFSLFCFVIVLCSHGVLCQWPGSFSRKQVRIFEGTVSESLHNIMPYEPFDYTEPNISQGYGSSSKFSSRGMGHLYYFTNLFINNILKDQAYPEGILQVVDGNTIQLSDVRKEWAVYWRHYGPTLAVILSLTLLGLLMPVFGLLFCCCRCTGRCSARTAPFDKRYDFCRRHSYGMLLLCITVLISFGVVCSFVTNENLEEGTHNLARELRTGLHDVDLYVNNTKVEVNHLLINNFNEFDKSITKILKASGEIVKNKLGSVSKATVLTNLTNIVHGLAAIRNDLKEIDSLTRSLQTTAEQLDIALKDFRRTLLEKLNQCKSQQACRTLMTKYNIKDLSLEANFTRLPNVTASLQNVSELISSDIEHEVLKGKQAFENIKLEIQRSVDEHIPEIKDFIGKIGGRLDSGARDMNQMLDRFHQVLAGEGGRTIDHGDSLLRQYGHYRYYVGLGVSFILLTVLMCLSLGLLCGFCGSRPDSGYSDDCCNKGSGASFLMLGVWVMFIASAALAFVTLIYFITGVSAERVICEPLKHPGDSRIFSLVDQILDPSALYGDGQETTSHHVVQGSLTSSGRGGDVRYQLFGGEGGKRQTEREGEGKTLTVSEIVRSCHKNASLFNVLQLRHVAPLAELMTFPKDNNLREYIQKMTKSMKINYNIKILTPEATEQLLRLSLSPLSDIDFPAYTHILGERITSIDLLKLSAALNETLEKLPSSQNDLKLALRNMVMYLKVHHETQVMGMLDLSKRLEASAILLSEHLKFNHTSLRAAVDHLLLEVEDAQKMLDQDGPNIVAKLGSEFGSEFEKHVDHYVSRVINHLEFDVGKCWPLSLVYNATLTSGCSKILSPYNGFWFAAGCVLLLFIPAIFISVRLASLYQKLEPYPGPEEEYLYDAYAASGPRDNIPLGNVGGKKKKHRNKAPSHAAGGDAYGGPDALNPDYSAHLGRNERQRLQAASGSTPGASGSGADPRFNDMAPKNWDFPNNGPPRYQQSTPLSTEYERPPPYYYPGPPK